MEKERKRAKCKEQRAKSKESYKPGKYAQSCRYSKAKAKAKAKDGSPPTVIPKILIRTA